MNFYQLITISEGAHPAYTSHDLIIRGCEGDAHIVICHGTKGAARSYSNIAFAEQIESELSTPAPCAIGGTYINQNVKRSMRSVHIATKVFEETYCEVATMLVDLAHLGNAILRACQSPGCGALYDFPIIRGTMSLFFPASIPREVPLVPPACIIHLQVSVSQWDVPATRGY